MASFRLKFEQGLRARDIDVTHDLNAPADATLVIAGTRHLLPLSKVRRRGGRIVQRLDGINWVQRIRWTNARYHTRAEYGNMMLSLIRSRFSDHVIYQSQFIRRWWEDWYGVAKAPATVIINGVDLNTYAPAGEGERPTDKFRLLLLEGSLAGGLNSGLFYAVSIAEKLAKNYPMEIVVAGTVDEATRKKLQSKVPVNFLGVIPRENVPALARSSHLMYCAEVNPPCPNSVIESLACGLPVIGFDSGALKELVGAEAGCVVPYGGDPWKLETPDIATLATEAEKILENQNQFRTSARKRAEDKFGLDKMTDAYVKVLLEN